MPLPTSRNTTYVASDPPKANDLNAFQDAIIGGKHGTKIFETSGFGISAIAGTWLASDGGPIMGIRSFTSNAWGLLALPLHRGDRIQGVTFAYYAQSAGNLSAALYLEMTLQGSTTTVSPLVLTTITEVTLTFPAVTIAASQPPHLMFSSTSTNVLVGRIRITYDRP